MFEMGVCLCVCIQEQWGSRTAFCKIPPSLSAELNVWLSRVTLIYPDNTRAVAMYPSQLLMHFFVCERTREAHPPLRSLQRGWRGVCALACVGQNTSGFMWRVICKGKKINSRSMDVLCSNSIFISYKIYSKKHVKLT